MTTKKKIALKDLTEVDFENAKNIIHYIVRMQTAPINAKLVLPILQSVKNDESMKHGLVQGFHAGLRDGLVAGLVADLDDGLRDGLVDSVIDLVDDLRADLRAGLDDGLQDDVVACLDAGLRGGLSDGLIGGLHHFVGDLRDGLVKGLHDDLSSGLGLDDGLNVSLYANLVDSIARLGDNSIAEFGGLRKRTPIKLIYSGVWWSWWLARYMIAKKWGCELDEKKLALLFGFCMHTPIILQSANKIFVTKPTKVKWNISGKTEAPFEFPIYELHADGESAVECLGSKFYYNHNLKIPEWLGKVKIADWRPEWVLQETNAEIRRCLLQNIPSDKLLEVLECETIDIWDSGRSVYELVEIKNNPYPSRYRALRFTCPTTGRPYLERTHPDETSARNANLVANYDIDTDSFGWEC